MRYAISLLIATIFIAANSTVVSAGEADVVEATIEKLDGSAYRVGVTVRHNDAGWDHYADRWEILTPQGDIIATRVLMHPHVKEQPFTRWLSPVELPKGIRKVYIRAHDSVHGYGGAVVELKVPYP